MSRKMKFYRCPRIIVELRAVSAVVADMFVGEPEIKFRACRSRRLLPDDWDDIPPTKLGDRSTPAKIARLTRRRLARKMKRAWLAAA